MKRQHTLARKNISLDSANIANQDCVLIRTDPSDTDYLVIRDKARLIADTRGVFEADGKAIVIA